MRLRHWGVPACCTLSPVPIPPTSIHSMLYFVWLHDDSACQQAAYSGGTSVAENTSLWPRLRCHCGSHAGDNLLCGPHCMACVPDPVCGSTARQSLLCVFIQSTRNNRRAFLTAKQPKKSVASEPSCHTCLNLRTVMGLFLCSLSCMQHGLSEVLGQNQMRAELPV